MRRRVNSLLCAPSRFYIDNSSSVYFWHYNDFWMGPCPSRPPIERTSRGRPPQEARGIVGLVVKIVCHQGGVLPIILSSSSLSTSRYPVIHPAKAEAAAASQFTSLHRPLKPVSIVSRLPTPSPSGERTPTSSFWYSALDLERRI